MSKLPNDYKDLNKRPDGFPPFATNDEGAFIVHQGEVFCRVPVGNSLCGSTRKYTNTPNLRHHMTCHRSIVVAPGYNSSRERRDQAQLVLEDLMRSAKAYAHETGTERSRDRSPTPENNRSKGPVTKKSAQTISSSEDESEIISDYEPMDLDDKMEDPENSGGEKGKARNKSVISTMSSLVSTHLRVIGLRSCGTVFEKPGTELALKKGTMPGLWTDFCLTNKVHNAVKHVRTVMQEAFPSSTIPMTPLCHEYHPADHEEFWLANLPSFPAGYRSTQPVFIVDRILQLPQRTRNDLIQEYFDQDEQAQQEAKDHPDNTDCLARIYLGERESDKQKSDFYDSLRNFPLRLNMIKDLKVDVSELAAEMAIGLAIMHWQAQVDGMDVEFVLGSSTTWDRERAAGYDDDDEEPEHTVESIKFKHREVHLWMLDFDKATKINLTKHDVKTKLAPAFLGNDPYYPRPQVDEELWDEFCSAYLKASEIILRGKAVNQRVMGLPQRFLDEALRVLREHENWNEEENIVFAE